MAEYNARIRQKRDTSANWTAKDPILLDGEIIIVDTEIPQPITFNFIEGNMKKEKEEMEELF